MVSRWNTKGYERRKSRCINKRLLPRCLFTLRFSRLMIHAYVFLTCFVHYIYSNAIELRSPRKLSGLFRNYSYFNHRFILSNFYQTKNSSTTNSQNHFHYSIILALFSVEVSTNSNSPILLFLHSFIYLFLSFPLSTWLNKRFSKFPSCPSIEALGERRKGTILLELGKWDDGRLERETRGEGGWWIDKRGARGRRGCERLIARAFGLVARN